jgi:hypothetical protein
MLSRLDEDQREALERAAECRRKADNARLLDVRESYLDMEQRWLRLAESYALLLRLETFANDPVRRK